MMDLKGGDPRRLEPYQQQVDSALARERSQADRHLTDERGILDDALGPRDPPGQGPARDPRHVLWERVRARRAVCDAQRAEDRATTDGAIEEDLLARAGFEGRVAQALSVLSSEDQTRDRAARSLAASQAESAHCLALVLAELGVISAALVAIRYSATSEAQGSGQLELVSSVELATARVHQLVGGLGGERGSRSASLTRQYELRQ